MHATRRALTAATTETHPIFRRVTVKDFRPDQKKHRPIKDLVRRDFIGRAPTKGAKMDRRRREPGSTHYSVQFHDPPENWLSLFELSNLHRFVRRYLSQRDKYALCSDWKMERRTTFFVRQNMDAALYRTVQNPVFLILKSYKAVLLELK